jgi:uncharacterized damage-inducible protein DinB
MIEPAYVVLMARYNTRMNRTFIDAAGRLTDDQRRADRGVFWRSIHGTFGHLLWADHAWLARFTGAPPPTGTRDTSDRHVEDFGELSAMRAQTDAELEAWAGGVAAEWLSEPAVWFRGQPSEFRSARALQVVHMFNHQAHHRGQIHAVLTGFGEDTGVNDLWQVCSAPIQKTPTAR